MVETVQLVTEHGYWVLALSILGRQACLPIPANLMLLAAGALARSGKLSLAVTLGLPVLCFVLADLLWFHAGRLFGDRILRVVCRFSPGTCAEHFSRNDRRGVNMLLYSKFVIGLDAVAVPLAGATGLTMARFLRFEILGAMIWTASYTSLGFLFARQLDVLAARAGAFLATGLAAAIGFHLAIKFVHSRQRRADAR